MGFVVQRIESEGMKTDQENKVCLLFCDRVDICMICLTIANERDSSVQ